jgi:hypothetical protein
MRIGGRGRTVQAKGRLRSGVFRECACDFILGVAPCGNAGPLSNDTCAAAGVFRVIRRVAAISVRRHVHGVSRTASNRGFLQRWAERNQHK